LLRPVIKQVLGSDVKLIDSAKQVAIEVKKILAVEGLLNKARRSRRKFYVSDNPEWFSGLAERFLGQSPKNVMKVNGV